MVAKLLRMLQKVPRILRTEGVRGVIRRVFQKLRVVPTKTIMMVYYKSSVLFLRKQNRLFCMNSL